MKTYMVILLITGWGFFPTPAFTEPVKCAQLADVALDAFRDGEQEESRIYANEVIESCANKALEQQESLRIQFPRGLRLWISPTDLNLDGYDNLPEVVSDNKIVTIGWEELNAVSIAYYILAEIANQEGKYAEARNNYQKIIDQYPDAYQRAYQGWFWKLSGLAQDSLDIMGTPYNYGDYQVDSLINKAWGFFHKKDLKGAELYASKCIKLYDSLGLEYNKEINVARFLLGRILLAKGQKKESMEQFAKIAGNEKEVIYPDIKDYPYFNNITQQAKDYLAFIDTPYDFGNYTTETLTNKAWKSWDTEDFRGVELFTKKCIDLWGEKARAMQQEMNDFAKGSFIPFFWAVNDVGTCYFVLGMMYEKQNNFEKAREMYETIIKELGYAQCWDPKGHYWKVAGVSQERLAVLSQQQP